MKTKINLVCRAFLIVVIMLLMPCALFSQPRKAEKPPVYFTGAGGKGESIAVMPISGSGLSAEEAYLPSLVQNVLVEAFSNYSAMEVLDRVNLEKIIKEGETDFYVDDNTIIRYGTLIASKYQLHGTLQKTQSGGFVIMLKAAEAKNAQQKATYNDSCQIYEIDDLSAARKAACDILPRMGVNLTDAGKKALLGPVTDNQARAQIMLAKGITANRQGTVIQAADYFYQAASIDPSLQEASNRASVISSTIKSGDIGMDIRNEIAWYNEWVKYVKDADAYFNENPPVEIIHENDLAESNLNKTAGTIDFSFFYIALPTNGGNVINDLNQGLVKTNRNQQWKLKPEDRWENIKIEAQLLNDKGEIIGRAQDTISCDLNKFVNITRRNISDNNERTQQEYFNAIDEMQKKREITDSKLLIFKGVDVFKISDNLKIKFVSSKNIAVSAVNKITDLYTGDNALPFRTYRINYEGLHLFGLKNDFKAKKDFIIPEKIGRWNVVGAGEFYKEIDGFLSRESNLKAVKNIVLPPGLKHIYKDAFCFSEIKDIKLPPNLVTIGDNAFKTYSLKVKNLIIPNSVTAIGKDAFGSWLDRCSSITIPANVTLKGDQSFEKDYNAGGKKAGTYTFSWGKLAYVMK